MINVDPQSRLRTIGWGGLDCWTYAVELRVAQRSQIEKAISDLLSFATIASGPDFSMLAAAGGMFAVCLRDTTSAIPAQRPALEVACNLMLMTGDISDVLHNLKATGAKYDESIEGSLRKIEFRIHSLGVVIYGPSL